MSAAVLLGVLAHALFLPLTAQAVASAAGAAVVISNFHSALKRGDGTAALAMMADDVVIFESGYGETKREYAAHHLASDIEFAKTTTRLIKATASRCVDMTCLFTEQTETKGIYRGKPVKSFGVETTVLEQRPGGWQIVHVHWSSHK